MMTGTRACVYADAGPVASAVRILATRTTLAEHVTVHEGDPLQVEVTDDIPFELWGSGTQALWRLLCSVAYSADAVSLYGALSRLDRRNTAAVADAFAALCRAGDGASHARPSTPPARPQADRSPAPPQAIPGSTDNRRIAMDTVPFSPLTHQELLDRANAEAHSAVGTLIQWADRSAAARPEIALVCARESKALLNAAVTR